MARISLAQLEKLCRRTATGINAGVDVRTVWQKELDRGTSTHRAKMDKVVRQLNQGESLANAVASLQGYLPRLTVEMIRVGEESGRLGEVLERLADHYGNIRQLWRSFFSMIWWPLMELAGAICVIALLIMVLGLIGEATRTEPIDLFGLGLSWQGNLMLFLGVVFLLLGTIGGGAWALFKGWFGPAPLAIAMRIPVLGATLQLLALSRFAWSFGMAIDAGMSAQASMQLGLASTQNAYFMSHEAQILASIDGGSEFHQALRKTGAFPEDFLDTLDTAEMSGTVTESLDRLSHEYQDKASAMFRVITVIGGVLVMLLVGSVIVFCAISLIIKLYIGPMYDLLEETTFILPRTVDSIAWLRGK